MYLLWSSYVSGRLLAKCNSGRACVDKYLADAEEPDLDIKLGARLVEGEGEAVAELGEDGQAVTSILRHLHHRRVLSVSSLLLARCTAT